jgi:hypothetical protein
MTGVSSSQSWAQTDKMQHCKPMRRTRTNFIPHSLQQIRTEQTLWQLNRFASQGSEGASPIKHNAGGAHSTTDDFAAAVENLLMVRAKNYSTTTHW